MQSKLEYQNPRQNISRALKHREEHEVEYR